MNWWVLIASVVGSILGGAGGAEIIKAVARRKPRGAIQAESEVSLARQTQAYAAQLEEDAAQARATAREAWAQVQEAQAKMVMINRKLDETVRNMNRLASYSQWLVASIMERGQSIERLRVLVESEPPPATAGMNGH